MVIKSWYAVVTKKAKNIALMPAYLMILADDLEGIFFENRIKNAAKLTQSTSIPNTAHGLDGLAMPFTAFSLNKLQR